MLKRNLLLKFSLLMLVALMLVGFPALMYAAGNDTWLPTLPTAGQGSLVLVNYNGDGGELTVDLARGSFMPGRVDKQSTNEFVIESQDLYIVPIAANDIPGRMQINLVPGTYRYTANVANIGSVNHTIEIVAGQVMALSFFAGTPQDVVNNHNSNGDHTSHSSKNTELQVAEEDITGQAR